MKPNIQVVSQLITSSREAVYIQSKFTWMLYTLHITSVLRALDLKVALTLKATKGMGFGNIG